MNRYLSTACLCFVFSVAVVAQDLSSLGANKIAGQILVSHAGKIQKTGLAPIWIYDATNSQLTTTLTLPEFGGRGRKDWERIVTAYTNSLNVYSNYEHLSRLPPQTQSNRIAVAEEYLTRKQELNGKTSGPDFEAVQQLEAKFKKSLLVEYQSWDRMNDEAEYIFYWYNVNPGILYVGKPAPAAVVQTDRDGRFNFTLPDSKTYLLATHIEGVIDGQPGHYFWLIPVSTGNTNAGHFVLDDSNTCFKKKKSELPQIILPKTNGFIGNVGFWMLNRVRDARRSE